MENVEQNWLSCSDVCGAGEYVSQQCTNVSQTQCSKCKVSCPFGFFMRGSCDGTTSYDAVQCVPCRESCAAGEYRSGLAQCAGNTTFDTVACAPCRKQCSNGRCSFLIFSDSCVVANHDHCFISK